MKKIEIKENANPVFLLDLNRLNRYKISDSLFDNSYDIYDQDLPSAKFFLDNGIDTIIVRSEKIEKDLVSYELPTNTKLVDSISVAGKLAGNGNGMQYMGSVLVVSDLSEEELNVVIINTFESLGINRPWEGDFDDFMANSNNRLVFE